MKLLDEKEMSEWAYHQCLKGNDTSEIRKLINDSGWAYWYCKNIKDIKEMESKINDEYWLWSYIIHVKKCGPELWVLDKE